MAVTDMTHLSFTTWKHQSNIGRGKSGVATRVRMEAQPEAGAGGSQPLAINDLFLDFMV